MPSSASQRRTMMDQAVLTEVQHGPAPTAPFVPSWRRGWLVVAARTLLVLLVFFGNIYAGYLIAYWELGLL